MDDEALIRRSDELFRRDEWGAEALEANRELVERFPDAAGAQYRLALCFECAGDILAARAAFERFLARRSSGLEARVARRRLAVLEERARAVATPSPQHALAAGRALARAGALERARVWYDRAEETAIMPSELAQARTGQASVLRTERKFQRALAAANRAVAADPSRETNMPAYAIRIALLADLGRLESARAEADLLVCAHPRNQIVGATAARVYAQLAKRIGEVELRSEANRRFAQSRHGR